MDLEMLVYRLSEYSPKLWEKHGLTRIYMTGGYIEIKDGGITPISKTLSKKVLGDLSKIQSIIDSLQGTETGIPGIRRLTKTQADALAYRPAQENRSSLRQTYKELDAMYGRGNWDDRDREDYEG